MNRYAITILLGAAVGLAAVGGASAKRQPHPSKIRVLVHTIDNGCAGRPWANDTIRRVLTVHRNEDGSYAIAEEDNGRFVTNRGGAAASPGNCRENRTRHGRSVRPGVVGTLGGYLRGTVTAGTFDPGGACGNPCSGSEFIAAYFGSDAKFSCLTNSRDCKFKWVYHAKRNQRLRFRYWEDSGTGAGTFLKERFKGDIAGA